MRSLWKLCILLLLLQDPADCRHHQHSGLAHILAAGLIVQLLSHQRHHHGHHHHHHGHHHQHQGHHHHGHHHEGRHGGALMLMEQPSFHDWGAYQETSLQPDLFAPYFPPWPHHHHMMATQDIPIFFHPPHPGLLGF